MEAYRWDGRTDYLLTAYVNVNPVNKTKDKLENEMLSHSDCNNVVVISRDNPIELVVLYLCRKLIDADCAIGTRNSAKLLLNK